MSLVDSVVTVNISTTTKGPTKAGFGTPLLLAFHTVTAKKLFSYTSLAGLISDGFTVAHPVYRMALKAFAQNPAPTKVFVGQRLIGTTQICTLTPKNTTAGFHYQFTVTDYLGVQTVIDYTVLGGATATTISTALAALLVIAHVTTTSSTFVTLTSTTAGSLFNLSNLPGTDDLAIANTSTDPGIAADYAAIKAIDASSWYGVAIDSNSKAEIEALAAQVEADRKVFFANTTDSAVDDNASTTDVAYQLKASNYSRTALLFSQTELLSYSGLAWMANRFPYNTGKTTYCFVVLQGVTVDNLKDGQVTNITAKNCNVNVVLAGSSNTYPGVDCEGEYIDLVTGTDWLHARLQERVIGAMQAASASGTKIPYTDKGVSLIVGLVLAQLAEGVSAAFGLLAAVPAPTCTAPLVADVGITDRGNRNLPDVAFSANFAGAILATTLTGTISV